MKIKDIVDKDIDVCEKSMTSGSVEENYIEYKRIRAKYEGIIDNFNSGTIRNWGDDGGSAVRQNLKIFKEKLELFKAMEYKNCRSDISPKVSITNNNTNSNTIDINISFEQARKNIENMTALPDSEVEEILTKVDELERIVQSKDRKTKKWENAKEIIKWIADKGVDVGIALLPLLLQIQ